MDGILALVLASATIAILGVVIFRKLACHTEYRAKTKPPPTLLSLHRYQATFNSLTLYHLPSQTSESKITPPTTIFFIPGAGGSAEQYHNQIATLHPTHNVVLIEHPGHGANALSYPSPPSTALSPTSLVSHIQKIITHFSTSKNILIAHSYACALIPLILNTLPTTLTISSILLISPPLSQQQTLLSTILLSLPNPILSLLRKQDRAGGPTSPSVSRMLHQSAHLSLREQQLIWNARTPSGVVKALMKQRYIPNAQAYGNMLEEKECLVVVGKEDRITKMDDARIIANECKARFLVVENCGHQVMVEKPQVINRLLCELVQER